MGLLRTLLGNLWRRAWARVGNRSINETRAESVVGPRPIYLYFDEAGDLNFKGGGTQYYMFGVLVTRNPWPVSDALTGLRRELYEGRFIPEYFHASEDLQAIRDRVFETICALGGFVYDVIVVEKRLVPEPFREQHKFYTFVADFALRLSLNHYPTAEPVFVITDAIPVSKKRAAVIKGFKQCLASVLGDRAYEIGHHSSAAHPCLQAADYLNWAVFRKWERSDLRSYVLVESFVRGETKFDWGILK